MADASTPIALTGPRGFADLPVKRAQTGRLVLQGALREALGEDVRARMLPRKGGARIAARLGRDAPPGRHEATLKTDEGEFPVTIDIPRRERLRATPGSLDVTAPLGGRVAMPMLVENTGNVALPLPDQAIAGLFASDGVATAFSAAYGSDAEDGLAVLGQFVLNLRRAHLSLARLKLATKDAGPLQPGEAREVTAQLALPKATGKGDPPGIGRRFHAVFVMDHLRLTVRLTLAADGPERKG